MRSFGVASRAASSAAAPVSATIRAIAAASRFRSALPCSRIPASMIAAIAGIPEVEASCSAGVAAMAALTPAKPHHARARELAGANFAPVFTFWDQCFGTFRAPTPGAPRPEPGIDGERWPADFRGQLLAPFRGPQAG